MQLDRHLCPSHQNIFLICLSSFEFPGAEAPGRVYLLLERIYHSMTQDPVDVLHASFTLVSSY